MPDDKPTPPAPAPDKDPKPEPKPTFKNLKVIEKFSVPDQTTGKGITVSKGANISGLPEDQQMKALRAYPDLSQVAMDLEVEKSAIEVALSKIYSSRNWRVKNKLAAK